MKNEKILIFGDSYSTFEGYIPEGFLTYYPNNNPVFPSDVKETWWHILAEETESQLVQNNSWSGSTICNTGYDGDCSKYNSFIFRLQCLVENGFFEANEINRVLVFGGTNDSWSGNTVGEPMFSDWTAEDLRLILPGISYFMAKLTEMVDNDKISFIINTELKTAVADGIATICEHYNVQYIRLSDIEKFEGHPTKQGMKQIKDQVLSNLSFDV